MKVGIPKEIHEREKRVALTPNGVMRLIKSGHTVVVESGAGLGADHRDGVYREAGATIATSARELWSGSELVLKVRAPEAISGTNAHEADWLSEGKILVSFIWPAQNEALMKKMASRKATVLAMDCVPRISRAQKLDALSSMANIAGYRAVVEAANHFGRFFAGQMTAAGKVPPAKVLVIGAGVAGLASIGAASSMGAIVRAFDTRLEVKEQVESMGAEFLKLEFEGDEDGSGVGGYAKVMSDEFIKAEMELFAAQAMEVDIIITTALIPGKPAPELITKGMVASMKPGSVIVDLAGEQGGNCMLTQADNVIVDHGVTIIGYTNLPSRMAAQSSQLYGNNVCHLLDQLAPEGDGKVVINMDDEVIRGATVIKDGEITWPPPPPKLKAAAQEEMVSAAPRRHEVAVGQDEPERGKTMGTMIGMAVAALAIFGVGSVAPASFLNHFTVFVLACFVGWQVVWNVTPALHTPLMSVTNAISGIIVIGALLLVGSASGVVTVLSAIAVLIASINIAGGFLVTQRMLKMFRK